MYSLTFLTSMDFTLYSKTSLKVSLCTISTSSARILFKLFQSGLSVNPHCAPGTALIKDPFTSILLNPMVSSQPSSPPSSSSTGSHSNFLFLHCTEGSTLASGFCPPPWLLPLLSFAGPPLLPDLKNKNKKT